jgi:hypothetical protein
VTQGLDLVAEGVSTPANRIETEWRMHFGWRRGAEKSSAQGGGAGWTSLGLGSRSVRYLRRTPIRINAAVGLTLIVAPRTFTL